MPFYDGRYVSRHNFGEPLFYSFFAVRIMVYMQISPHFSFKELSFTQYPQLAAQNTAAAKEYIFNLKILAFYVLEPARVILQTPLKVTSAMRCISLNSFVCGAAKSQHLYGQACDFVPLNMPLAHAFKLLKNSSLHYGQLIVEPSWLHISLGVPFRAFKYCCQSFRVK